MIRLRCMGDCLLETGSARITPGMDVLFATGLYLAIERGREVQRGELAELLWPSMPQKNAHHCLRQTLYRLRSFGVPVASGRSAVHIPADLLDTDYHLLVAEDSARRESVAEIAGRPFLPGYSPRFSDAFDEWLERQRDVVGAACRRILVAELDRARREYEWSRVEGLARSCLQIDPLNEEAVLALAEAHARHGSKALALKVLDRFASEIGAESTESLKLPASLLRKRISNGNSDAHVNSVEEIPLIGRSQDLTAIEQLLHRAVGGTGGTVLIWGEPGIGKTRLLSEVGIAASIRGFASAGAAVRWHDDTRPFAAFADLLPHLTKLPGALGAAPESLQCLRRITEPNLGGALPSPEAHYHQALYSKLRTSLLDLLDSITTETALALFIDDAQWLDEASIDFCGTIAELSERRRLALVLASRTEGLGAKRVFPQQALFHQLRPLSDSDAADLVRVIIDRAGIPRTPDFPGWCAQYGDGNPFRLQELALRTVVRHGSHKPPSTVTTLLTNRISSLPPGARRLLEAISLLGKLATHERLEALFERDRNSLLDSLAALEEEGLVRIDGFRMATRHDLVSETALARLTPGVKITLHRRIARLLAAEGGARHSVDLLWDAAQHWIHAGDANAARDALLACARHCTELGTPERAVLLLREALTNAPISDVRVELEQELARCLWICGRWDEVRALTSEVLQRRRSENVAYDDIHLLHLQAEFREARALPTLIEPLVEFARSDAAPDSRIRAAYTALMVADNLLDSAAGNRAFDSVRDIIHDKDVLTANRLTTLLVFHTAFGDPRQGAAAANELVSFARRQGVPMGVLEALRLAGMAKVAADDLPGALTDSREVFELARKHAQRLLDVACNQIAWVQLYRDDLESACEWIARARSYPVLGAVPKSNIALNAAELAWRQGEVARCREELSYATVIQRNGAHLRGELRIVALETLAAASVGDVPLVRSGLAQLEQHYEATRRFHDQDLVSAAMLMASHALGDGLEVDRLLGLVEDDLTQRIHPVSPTLARVIKLLAK